MVPSMLSTLALTGSGPETLEPDQRKNCQRAIKLIGLLMNAVDSDVEFERVVQDIVPQCLNFPPAHVSSDDKGLLIFDFF